MKFIVLRAAVVPLFPQRENKALKLDRVELSFCQRNKWDDDWAQYWFYAKIAFPSSSSSRGSNFSLAVKAAKFDHVNQAIFKKSAPGFKECSATFRKAACSIGGCDFVEEYLVAKIWPLSDGWRASSFAKVTFDGLSESIPCPQFGLVKPADVSDEVVVAELERECPELLGPYTNKEHKSFIECYPHGRRINRCLHEMKVCYEDRVAPPEPGKRGEAPVRRAQSYRLQRKGEELWGPGLAAPDLRFLRGNLRRYLLARCPLPARRL